MIIWLIITWFVLFLIANLINSNVHVIEPNDRISTSTSPPHSSFYASIYLKISVLGPSEYLGLTFALYMTWHDFSLDFSFTYSQTATNEISSFKSNSQLYFISSDMFYCQMLSKTALCQYFIFFWIMALSSFLNILGPPRALLC